MCHKFLPHFELFSENVYIANLIFKKIKKRRCTDDNPNAEISHHTACKITLSYRAVCKIATFYSVMNKIAKFY